MDKYTKEDIGGKDAFGYIIESADKALIVIEKIDSQIAKFSAKIKSISGGVDTNSIGGIKELDNAVKSLNLQIDKTAKLEKDKIRLEQLLAKANSEESKAISELAKQEQALSKERLKSISITERENISNEKNIKSEKDKIKIQQEGGRNRLEQIRIEKAREKSIDDYNRKSEKAEVLIKKQQSAYYKLSTELNHLRNEYKDLAVAEQHETAEGRKMLAQITKIDAKLKKIDASTGQHTRKVAQYENSWKTLKSTLVGLFAVGGIGSFISSLAKTEVRLNGLRVALKNVTNDQQDYANSLNFVHDLSINYGQDLVSLTDTYKNFRASAKSSGLAIREQNKVYESIIKTGSALNLNNEQLEGSLLAVSQMFSKGKVSAEELRGQLGERLPGAFGMMAKALKVTEPELNKMLEKGEVMAKEALPLLAKELENTYGTKAQENLKTVSGGWNILKTRLSDYVSEANEGGRVTKSLSWFLQLVGNNLKDIIPWVFKLALAFGTLKLVNLIKDFKGVAEGFKGVKDGANGAVSSSQKLGSAIKGIGLTVLISLLIDAGIEFYNLASGIDTAEKAQERYNKAVQNGLKNADVTLKTFDKQRESKIRQIELLKADEKISEKQFIQRKKEIEGIYTESVKYAKKDANEIREIEEKKLEKALEKFDKIQKKAKSDGFLGESGNEGFTAFFNINGYNDALQNIVSIRARIKALDSEKSSYKDVLSQQEETLHQLNIEQKENNKSRKEGNKIKEKEVQHLDEINKRQSEMNALLKEFNEIQAEKKLHELEEAYNELKQAEIDFIEQNGRKRLFGTEDIEANLNEEYEIRKDLLKQQEEYEIAQANEKLGDLGEAQRTALRKEYEEKKKTASNIEELDKEYLQRLQELVDEQQSIKSDVLQEEINIKSKYDLEKIKLEKDKNAEIESLNKDLEDALAQSNEKKAEDEKSKVDKQIQNEERLADFRKRMIEESLEQFKQASEEREKLIDKEIDASQKLADSLKEQANNGVITAQKSIAEQNKLTNEKIKEKQKEQKIQQQLDELKLIYSATEQYLSEGDTLPVAGGKAFLQVKGIRLLAKNLTGFFSGTERTIGEELGAPQLSGKDGHIVRVDGGEMVLNGGLVNKAKSVDFNATSTEIVNGFIKSRTMEKAPIYVQNTTDKRLIDRIDKLIDITENKTEFSMDANKLTDNLFEFVNTRKKGNDLVIDRYIKRK